MVFTVYCPRYEFWLRYHNFMITGDPGPDEHILGAWNVLTRELMVREELEQRGISYDTFPPIFSALGVPPLAALPPPPSLPQGLAHHR